ncbi:MAG: DUF3568 family protein [Phycisphaerales bacterium]|nr:MAG: DUF3568 family protein [Phycisphaerales bacterium]
MVRRIVLTALLAVSLIGSGCTTTMINPGTDSSATYRFGVLTAEESRDIATVYQAAESSIADLGLSVIQKVKDELEAKIVARDAQDKKIIIELVSMTASTTQVKIRVGSPDKARRIYQTIHDKL